MREKKILRILIIIMSLVVGLTALINQNNLFLFAKNARIAEYFHNHDEIDKEEIYLNKAVNVAPQSIRGTEGYAEVLLGLGEVYYRQHKFEQAEPILKQALDIKQRVYGSNSPKIAANLCELGKLYTKKRDYKKAEYFLKRALAIKKTVMTNGHAVCDMEMAAILESLADYYHKTNNNNEAEKMYKNALSIEKSLVGINSVDYTITIDKLSYFYLDLNKFKDAEYYMNQTLILKEKVEGADNIDLCNTLHNLGALYIKMKKYNQALPYLVRAISIYEKNNDIAANSIFTPDYVSTLAATTVIYEYQGKFDKAELSLEKAISVAHKYPNFDKNILSILQKELQKLKSRKSK